MQPDTHSRLTLAKAAARAAGDLQRSFSADLEVEYKTARDIVTAADLASQDLIVSMIRDSFPGDAVVAEEGHWDKPDGEHWVIDPLDGTVNYSRGLPMYGVSIAFVNRSGDIELGVIFLPAFDELYWATAGGGAFLNERPIHVSNTPSLDRALIDISDFNTGPAELREAYNRLKLEAIQHLYGRSMRIKNLSSAAVETSWVAAGRIDAYLMVFCHFWDAAAGALIIREAGGRVSDLDDPAFGADSTLVLCTNDLLHDELRRILGPLATHKP